jgi:SAM-dependent methyltransferase
MVDELRENLRMSYGPTAQARDARPLEAWKVEERRRFLELLQREGRRNMLELGAGPGKDGAFFAAQGLEVLCTDLSPEMVAACEAKGLAARVMDFARLDLPDDSFDAAYALNCLLHLPDGELPDALREIHRVIRPGGPFFLGLYGGFDEEEVWADDVYEPKRFFALRSDERLKQLVGACFEICSFRVIAVPGLSDGMHFQSLVLRK